MLREEVGRAGMLSINSTTFGTFAMAYHQMFNQTHLWPCLPCSVAISPPAADEVFPTGLLM